MLDWSEGDKDEGEGNTGSRAVEQSSTQTVVEGVCRIAQCTDEDVMVDVIGDLGADFV